MKEQKRLLLVATRQFWPITGGRSYTLFHYCRILCEQYGYSISVFCFSDQNTRKETEIPFFLHDVRYGDAPSINGAMKTVFMKSLIRKKYPIQASLMYDEKIRKLLLQYVEEIQPDVLMLDMIRLLPYADGLEHLQAKKIFLEDDILEKRYERQLASVKTENIAGNYSSNLSSGFNRIINRRWIRNIILRREIELLNSYESHGAELFDYVGFVSPVETREYNLRFQTEKAITLVVGTEIEEKTDLLSIQANTLSIVGDFMTPANMTSLKWVCDELLPLLPEDITYHVIGRCPEHLRKEITDKRVTFLGYVDDLRKAIGSTALYLAPIVFGSGIKTKIIEAMAIGTPVVTNHIGAEGLEVVDGKEMMIADTPEELAVRVQKLLENESLRKELGENGRKYVKENHSWDKLCAAFDQMGL